MITKSCIIIFIMIYPI